MYVGEQHADGLSQKEQSQQKFEALERLRAV